jgi:membrane protease YdiL (CAAX protease family)
VAVVAGACLGLGARAYLSLLGAWWPEVAEATTRAAEYLSQHSGGRLWLGFLAVVCAPLAEEYLFRGLLYRALDREWGAWRAILASAAFFAIYHPAISWPPVAALGVLTALLFRHGRRLWLAVAAHAAYNLVVLQ